MNPRNRQAARKALLAAVLLLAGLWALPRMYSWTKRSYAEIRVFVRIAAIFKENYVDRTIDAVVRIAKAVREARKRESEEEGATVGGLAAHSLKTLEADRQ